MENATILGVAQTAAKEKGSAEIAVFASSVTLGLGATKTQLVWVTLLEQRLNQSEEIPSAVINVWYSGYSTADLLAKGKIKANLKIKPDVVLFEPCLLHNNWYPHNSLKQIKTDIQLVMTTFQRKLPSTLVVLQTANPTVYNDVILVDAVHPNRDGYQLWETILEKQLKRPSHPLN